MINVTLATVGQKLQWDVYVAPCPQQVAVMHLFLIAPHAGIKTPFQIVFDCNNLFRGKKNGPVLEHGLFCQIVFLFGKDFQKSCPTRLILNYPWADIESSIHLFL